MQLQRRLLDLISNRTKVTNSKLTNSKLAAIKATTTFLVFGLIVVQFSYGNKRAVGFALMIFSRLHTVARARVRVPWLATLSSAE